VLKRRDQGPYRHEDEKQDQDHDDQGYEGATAHATALFDFVSIWRSILAAGRRRRQSPMSAFQHFSLSAFQVLFLLKC
jgi:hypothetical protein